MGHGLGLADIYDPFCSEVTMFGYSSFGSISPRTIEKQDIAGIKKLY